jgi:aspartyl-tRNA(Asn)/glutamyl-tRNA(Gln) amidotransferase subunit C
MVDESEVRRVAGLADMRIPDDDLPAFTARFNRILEYFDVLDTLEDCGPAERGLHTVLREDEPCESLPQEAGLGNAGAAEDGFVRAPRVM